MTTRDDLYDAREALERQSLLWDQKPPPPVANPTVTAEEAPRLERLALAILAAFEAAPDRTLDNRELLMVGGMRFGARIHECRSVGHVIDIVSRDRGTGLVRYTYRGHDPR